MSDLEYHANQGTLSLGSGTAFDNLVGGTVRFSAARIDGNKQGTNYERPGAGIKSCKISATFFLDSDEAPPDSGQSGSASFRYRDATTDGVVSGTFLLLDVSMAYRLNNYVAFDVELESVGTYTITAPIP